MNIDGLDASDASETYIGLHPLFLHTETVMKRSLTAASIASIAAFALVAACSAPQGAGEGYGQAAHRHRAGVDYCPERLPAAQERIRELYSQAHHDHGERVEAQVTLPNGETISVSVETGDHGRRPSRRYVRTGLSDLVFNCGADFGEQDCFVEIYLDGRQLADLGPTVEGQVPFRCLSAGRHRLRIERVGQTIFDQVILLESDREHLAEIRETGTGEYEFSIYAVNDIHRRIPVR